MDCRYYCSNPNQMTMSNSEDALLKLFKVHRVVFWYDEGEQLIDDFNELSLQGVEKIIQRENPFKLKHRVLMEEPKQKFLLYIPDNEPAYKDNWLLDVQLAHVVFRTDKASMYLQELGLDYGFKDFIEKHLPFFESKERRETFKTNLQQTPDHKSMRYNMLNVTFKSQFPTLENFIQIYAGAFLNGNERPTKELERYGLLDFFWKEVERRYKYTSDAPDIYDFLCKVFDSVFAIGGKSNISPQGKVLLSMWSDTLSQKGNYEAISKRIGETLGVQEKLQSSNYQNVLGDDLFELNDQKVIADLGGLIIKDDISRQQLEKAVKARENKYWYYKYREYYLCLLHAKAMIDLVDKYKEASLREFFQGIKLYEEELYQVDLHYRKAIFFFRKTNQSSVLSELMKRLQKVYSNDWLLPIGDAWQNVIDLQEKWPITDRISQRLFYRNHIEPIASEKSRLFVVISDALRFEIGQELHSMLVQENRFESKLSSMVSSIPSYTQLGMASLLPHENIEIGPGNDSVSVDGISTVGTKQREKVLQGKFGNRATTIKSDEFVAMSSSEGRAYVKNYDLVYIYHNTIDKVGDDKATEEKLFDAVEQSFDELFEILKKIANVNGNNILLTADHGFTYQYDVLDESDFTAVKISGEKWKENRRFILGQNLGESKSLQKFSNEALGIHNQMEVAFPKSINRLRVKGAGSRFVHGGTALQEVVIPLLQISKKRKDTVSKVQVDIIKSTDKITTNILAVSFMQKEPVSEGIIPRKIRAFLQATDGATLSDIFEFNFDLDADNIRQREIKHRFQLSAEASAKYKNQSVKLVLQDAIEGTNRWDPYTDFSYTLNIAFTNDFDDW